MFWNELLIHAVSWFKSPTQEVTVFYNPCQPGAVCQLESCPHLMHVGDVI